MARQLQYKKITGKRRYDGSRKMARSSQYVRRKSQKYRSGTTRVGGYYGRYNNGDNGVNERKFFDTSLNFTVDTTGEVPATGQLALIPQGTTESSRIGRKACIKSIHIRAGAFYIPGADTVGSTVSYIYLVLDKQCNGAAAAITDVLTSSNMSLGMVNMANSERFVILKRFIVPFQAGAGVSGAYGQDRKALEFFHKCSIPMEWSSTTGAIAEIKSHNLFLLAGNEGGTGTDDSVSIVGTCRLRFSDN